MPAAVVAARGRDSRRSLRHHHLCNWELCCNNWLAAALCSIFSYERSPRRNIYPYHTAVRVVSTAAATKPPAKGAKGTLPLRVDITIIGWIHKAIGDSRRNCGADDRLVYSRITHRTTDGRHASKNVVLIMPSGWTAVSVRCKANWVVWQRQMPLCRQNIG